MHAICVVATGKDVGKTTVCIGLVKLLRDRGLRVNFIKPVGQSYIQIDSARMDKDSILMRSVYDLKGDLTDMSPVTIPRGFVQDYIFKPDVEPLKKRVLEAYERLSRDCDVLVVEGTGHAGVGSCFDLSNADVAALMNAQALVVAEGGIGSTIDEVCLNVSLFQAKGVNVLGVVVNKVFPDKWKRLRDDLARGLGNKGLTLLGVLPHDMVLTYPRMGQIAQVLGAQVLCGQEALDTRVENVIVAAMEPQNFLPRIRPHTLMITPGDRIDNILVALNTRHYSTDVRGAVDGIVLTGGLVPDLAILEIMKPSGVPVLLCKENTYPVAAEVNSMVFKILPDDLDKIELAQRLVRDHLDVETLLCKVLGDDRTQPGVRAVPSEDSAQG